MIFLKCLKILVSFPSLTFFFYFLFIWKAERQRERETDRQEISSISWFSPQEPTTARPGLSPSQEPGTYSVFLMWDPSTDPSASQLHISRKQSQALNQGMQIRDAGNPSSVLTAWPNSCSSLLQTYYTYNSSINRSPICFTYIPQTFCIFAFYSPLPPPLSCIFSYSWQSVS